MENSNLMLSMNAQCPCRSGKKYKACCKGKITSEQDRYYGLLHKEKIMKDKIFRFIAQNIAKKDIDEYSMEFNGKHFSSGDMGDGIQFFDWLFYEKRFLKDISDKINEEFDSIEKEIFKDWLDNTQAGLFEIESKDEKNWTLELKEIFEKKKYSIKDRLASREMIRGDIIFARMQTIFSENYLSGISTIFPRMHFDELKEFAKEKYSAEKKIDLKLSYSDFMNSNGKLLIEFKPKQPKFITKEGHDLCFFEKEYKFDIKIIEQILDFFSEDNNFAITELKYPKKGFEYAQISRLADPKEKQEDNKTERSVHIVTHLISPDGKRHEVSYNIEIKKNVMKISGFSKERVEYAEKQLMKHFRKFFTFVKETCKKAEDIYKQRNEETAEEMQARKKMSKKQTAVAKSFFEDYYKDWCYMKIPALGNITPKEALKTSNGKHKLKELLLEFENQEERSRKDKEYTIPAIKIIRKELDFYE